MTRTRTMTRERLLHLADRARRGVALPAEHDALTAGINAMADRLERAEAAAATSRELELRQRSAWSAAGQCPMCSHDNTDGRLCGNCTTTVRRLPSHHRRQWRRYEPINPNSPIQSHGYTPAGLLGITPGEHA